MEQIESDRRYQQRILKIEEQRLENERIAAENNKKQAEQNDRQKYSEWDTAVADFFNKHPEYAGNNVLTESFKEELRSAWAKESQLGNLESKKSLLEKAHQSLKTKEFVSNEINLIQNPGPKKTQY